MTTRIGRAVAMGTLGLALGVGAPASAGDRALQLVVANMAPDGTQSECIRDILGVFRHEEVEVTRLGGRRIRQLAGHDADTTSFLAFEVEELASVPSVLRRTVDGIALIDCRAEDGYAAAWVSSPAGGAARIELRQTVIDAPRAEWLANTILLHARTGFSP